MITGCPDDGPTMTIDQAGAVHIVWPKLLDGPQPATRLFHASTTDGQTFTPPRMVQSLGSPKPAHPQMALDACGDLALVWDEAQGSSRRIAMTRLAASSVTEKSQPTILSGDQSGIYPVIGPTNRGFLVAWTEVSRDSDRSSIVLRQVEKNPSCGKPAAAAQ
jgi:hypothetical protein